MICGRNMTSGTYIRWANVADHTTHAMRLTAKKKKTTCDCNNNHYSESDKLLFIMFNLATELTQ